MAKQKQARFWILKIIIITLFLSAGISVVAQYLTEDLSVFAAFVILMIIVLIGVVFDTIGVAFATCDKTPFVALASKKNKSAKHAIRLLKNAPTVASFCNDVVGDICGIVSGAAGVAIGVKIILLNGNINIGLLDIIISSFIAAVTVGLKAYGKQIAMANSKKIVSGIAAMLSWFKKD